MAVEKVAVQPRIAGGRGLSQRLAYARLEVKGQDSVLGEVHGCSCITSCTVRI